MSEQTLLDRVNDDLKEAMRRKDETAKLALRSVKSAILEAQKSGNFTEALTDAELVQVIGKTAKQRRDTIVEYQRVGRPDLAAVEAAELTVIERYLPQQLSAAQLEEIVRAVIAETGAQSMRDMNKVMPVAMQRVAGQADGRAINQIVRQLLG
ncbi:MAG: GatB/YqeY domain-containing protein [Chloroflexi bacterium]|nr:MAG: GatB/YqeY domain-containing protein [Chloroflexota bacterium]